LVLSHASTLTGTALGQGASPSFCLDVHPSNRFMSHSETPSPGSGRIVSTSWEAINPVYGEKVYSDDVRQIDSCLSVLVFGRG
jgi:hypothetical protein